MGSEDSKLEAEFNLTNYLKPGKNDGLWYSAGATAVIWKIKFLPLPEASYLYARDAEIYP